MALSYAHRTEEAPLPRSESSLPARRCLRLALGLATFGWILIGGVIAAVMTLLG